MINNPIKKWLGVEGMDDVKYRLSVWRRSGNVDAGALAYAAADGGSGQTGHYHEQQYAWRQVHLSFAGGRYRRRGWIGGLWGCSGGAGLWYQHSSASGDPRHWSRVYEGRALGDDLNFLYEPEVTEATHCGVGIISLGWLNALGDASGGYGRDGYDGRREATIWSWAQGEDGSNGPLALLRASDGRWVARSNTTSETHPFACFLKRDIDPLQPGNFLDPTTFADPDGLQWYITKTSGVFAVGDNICRSETGGRYVFGLSRNAKMQDALIAALPASRPDVWLNYSIVPIPLPSAMPAPVNFNAVAGSATPPPPRTMQVYSNQGDTFSLDPRTNAGDGNWLLVSPMSGTVGMTGTPITVSVDPAVVSLMKPGPYTASILVFDVTLRMQTSIPVSLHVKAATSISIVQIAPSPVAEGGSAQVTAKLSYVPQKDPLDGSQVPATGSVVLRELITTAEQVNSARPHDGTSGGDSDGECGDRAGCGFADRQQHGGQSWEESGG